MTTRRVLFVHNGKSGRFRFIAEALRSRGWSGVLLNAEGGSDLPGFRTVLLPRGRFEKPQDKLFLVTNRALAAGRAVALAADRLKAEGFSPDLIIGHSGWGELVFLREVFPTTPQVQLAEYYYRTRGADVGFDPEFDISDRTRDFRLHANNAALLLSLCEADRIVAPTRFQADLFPDSIRSRIDVIHEGVDTETVRRRPAASVRVGDRTFGAGQPIVTFANRYFEPMRGFHVFMRMLPQLLGAHPNVEVLLIGSAEDKGYGPKLRGQSWRDRMIAEVGGRLDMDRVHFVGPVDHETFIDCLSISTAHVYLTYPFVLSWSLLDAMACECLVIGSDTAPVREVIVDGENGLLADFFDSRALAARLLDILAAPDRYIPVRRAARRTVLRHFDRQRLCVPAWLRLIEDVLSRGVEPREPRVSDIKAAGGSNRAAAKRLAVLT